MEPVTIITEVRRGDKVIMRMGCGLSGPGMWSSPTPDADILTPEGALCEILVLTSMRGHEWRGITDCSECAEDEALPTRALTAEDRAELEDLEL